MKAKDWDVIVLTCSKLLGDDKNWYNEQAHTEDKLVVDALVNIGLRATRLAWDNPEFDWNSTKAVLFRSVWDYFDRFNEFEPWLEELKAKTQLINPYGTILWNLDKHYLNDLHQKGVPVCPTIFIEIGDTRSLAQILSETEWKEFVIKPSISGAGRHTYKLALNESHKYEQIFSELIANESMMIQEFQQHVVSDGEISLMVMNGEYQHAVLKKAKKGDFRVQDDFGGSVCDYEASNEEKELAEKAIGACDVLPLYARVDIIKNNDGELCILELELIEPELWFRENNSAADVLAQNIYNHLTKGD